MNFDRTKVLNEEQGLPELKPLQADFLKDRKADLQKIKFHMEKNEFQEVEKITHNWKGFCAPYGFAYLADVAKALENDIKSGQSIEADQFVQDIEEYLKFKEEIL